MAEDRFHFVSAAIDFGTTFSGYAFSFLHDYKKEPTNITLATWNSAFMSEKVPTCVLFDPSGNFSSFGFEAEDKYSELAKEKEHEEWYFFRRFKMELYGERKINRDKKIKDICGKTMKAMKVFSEGIKYLKNHMEKTCKETRCGVSANNIRWVLTVPSIWSDSAKQFMRKSAEQAGIASDQLLIALEPEAASLFCRYITSGETFSALKWGSKYLVLDAGGGTFDTAVHKLKSDGSLKEIYKGNGGDWGGTRVDDAFGIFLAGIIGKSAYDRFCHYEKTQMLELFRDFENTKRKVNPKSVAAVRIKIPTALNECCKNETGKDIVQQVRASGKPRNTLTVVTDKLHINPKIVRDMFEEVAKEIVYYLEELLCHPNPRKVTSILMVGGFSESQILQDIIRENFEECKLKVIVPDDAGLAVLKGAVIYGHEPRTIRSRICKLTYGIKTHCKFDPDIHPESKRVVRSDGRERCKDIFDVHIRKNKRVYAGEPHGPRTYKVGEPDQAGIDFKVWTSYQPKPKYVTDFRCQELGSLKIEMPDTKKGLDRCAIVQMTFGGTQLEVEARDKFTGKSVSAWFDFL